MIGFLWFLDGCRNSSDPDDADASDTSSGDGGADLDASDTGVGSTDTESEVSSDVDTEGCGNGVIELTEICDDGNTVSGDNCTSECKKAPVV